MRHQKSGVRVGDYGRGVSALGHALRSSVWRMWLLMAALLGLAAGVGHAQGSLGTVSPASGTYPTGQPVSFAVTGISYDNWLSVNDYLILEVAPVTTHPWASACNIQYQPYTYTVYMTQDDGNSWSSGAIGSQTVLANSQCMVDLGAASVGVTAAYPSAQVVVNLPVTLRSTYTGAQYVSMARCNSSGCSFLDVGQLTVPTTTQVAPPIIMPGGGSYPTAPVVAMQSPTPGATIRYTVDGNPPTTSTGTVYSGPITVNGQATVKAIAYSGAWTPSSVSSATFSTASSLANDLVVTASSVSGTYAANNTVTTSGNVSDTSGNAALFTAGTRVSLEPGFHAYSGSSFRAAIASPDFVLWVTPINGSVYSGSAATFTVTVTSLFGFSSAVSLSGSSVTGLPAGATASFSTSTLTPSANGTASTTMTIQTSTAQYPALTPSGVFRPMVSGVSGSLTRRGQATLSVNALTTPSFFISPSSSSQTVTPGGATIYILTVVPENGFASNVTLSAALANGASLPTGMTLGLNPTTITNGTGTSTLSVTTSSATPGGTYNIVVTGTGGGVTASNNVALIVNAPISYTFTTSPGGLSLQFDNGSCTTAPYTVPLAYGSSHTVAVCSTTQSGGTGTQYVFSAWSDGTATASRTIIASSPATYTANFTTQYQLTTATGGAGAGTITPATGWYNSGATVTVTAAAGSGSAFTGFTGALTGTTNPQTLTMNTAKSVTATFGATSVVSFISTPSNAGFSITIGGTSYTLPATPALTAGTYTVSVTTPQTVSGTQYAFTGWADGVSSNPRSITLTGGSGASFTANFAALRVISGTVTSGTTPLAATLSLTGTGGSLTPAQTATADSGTGVFAFQPVLEGYTYTIVPALSGHSFCPAQISVPTLVGDKSLTIHADRPAREYIRLGGRVVAIESCTQ
jgi:hypothetical protein